MPGRIEPVRLDDLDVLLPLMRAYCDFYKVQPTDEQLTSLSTVLLSSPAEGLQLLARDEDDRAVGFATIYWGWQTLTASRTGLMNDLFVASSARGAGWAEALIDACGHQCRDRGIATLIWQTALDNERAQKVYDRVGGVSERWLDYSLPVDAA